MHDHDRGLSFDLSTLVTRRRALQLAAVGGLAAVVAGCGGSSSGSSDATTGATTGATGSVADAGGGATAEIPEETAGPFPADGSNGVDVLGESGIVRSDITTSFGSGSATAAGVPMAIALTVLDVAKGGAPVQGAAVYLWHCDREGRYSLYDESIAAENYLRGVQESGEDGTLTFKTIFPAAYQGRWPHVHFEVYESLDAATQGGSKLRTSQLAIPRETCEAVYATPGYEQSVANLAQLSLESDMVFADGYASQLATVSGSVEDGYTLTLNVGV